MYPLMTIKSPPGDVTIEKKGLRISFGLRQFSFLTTHFPTLQNGWNQSPVREAPLSKGKLHRKNYHCRWIEHWNGVGGSPSLRPSECLQSHHCCPLHSRRARCSRRYRSHDESSWSYRSMGNWPIKLSPSECLRIESGKITLSRRRRCECKCSNDKARSPWGERSERKHNQRQRYQHDAACLTSRSHTQSVCSEVGHCTHYRSCR